MKNISFSLTTPQFLARTKTVTRRLGGLKIKPGDRLMGCEKCMGRRKGEPLVRLGEIEVVSVRREPLGRMMGDYAYGTEETEKEGFGGNPVLRCPINWARGFSSTHKGCTQDTLVTRIEFRHVQPEQTPKTATTDGHR